MAAAAAGGMRCARAMSTGAAKPLYGTVPSHSSYIFLSSMVPPSEFPVRPSTAIERELQLRTKQWGTIINFAWTGKNPKITWDKTWATAFSVLGGRLEIPEVSLGNMDEVVATLETHVQHGPIAPRTHEEVHLYVCTHGTRDCRCGEHGGQFAHALKEEVERRHLGNRIKVCEVGHVGGHKYAANLLVYPHGEWLGQLRPDDVPRVIDAILGQPVRPFIDQDYPILPSHWRGRMGLGKDEQIRLFEKYDSRKST